MLVIIIGDMDIGEDIGNKGDEMEKAEVIIGMIIIVIVMIIFMLIGEVSINADYDASSDIKFKNTVEQQYLLKRYKGVI